MRHRPLCVSKDSYQGFLKWIVFLSCQAPEEKATISQCCFCSLSQYEWTDGGHLGDLMREIKKLSQNCSCDAKAKCATKVSRETIHSIPSVRGCWNFPHGRRENLVDILSERCDNSHIPTLNTGLDRNECPVPSKQGNRTKHHPEWTMTYGCSVFPTPTPIRTP